jgi:hypothetical protein
VKSLFANAFSVTPLYAMPLGGGGAGLVSGLSQIGPVTFTDSLSIASVANAKVRDFGLGLDGDTTTSQFKTPITVTAVSQGAKNPLAGVTITLKVIGNSGSFNVGGTTAVTDLSGVARFPNFYLDKAGGYTVTATSEFGTASQVTSNLFNVTGN